MGLADIRISNHSVFVSRKTPRVEKILMAMQDEKLELKPEDEDYKNLLVRAFTIMSEYPVLQKQVKMLIATGCSQAHAYNVIKDAQYVFGNIYKVNIDYQRNARREWLLKIIEKLKKEKPKDWYKLSLEANKQLIELDNLKKANQQSLDDELEDLTIPIVEFTSDPQALISPAEIVEHDEEE